MKWLQRRRTLRAIRRHSIGYGEWRALCGRLAPLHHLDIPGRVRLRALCALFLQAKRFSGAGGLEITRGMRLAVAVQACLPILYLGLSWYRGWVEIILYPGPFAVAHEEVDDAGVVSRRAEMRHGESWAQGPLILSWADVEGGLREPQDGYNVVVHECAHKLDMLDGDANGLPPLHDGMSVTQWADVMGRAYEDLRARCARDGGDPCAFPIDPYAATHPAEFFAVASEYFFTAPHLLAAFYPEVYRQLALFYRQEPLANIRAGDLHA